MVRRTKKPIGTKLLHKPKGSARSCAAKANRGKVLQPAWIPAMRARRGPEKREAHIHFRLTDREHAVALWLADELGFKGPSHMFQCIVGIANHLNDRRLSVNAKGGQQLDTPRLTLKMAGVLELPLVPQLKPSFSKRDILRQTNKMLLLRDGRMFKIDRTSLNTVIYWPVDIESVS